MSRAGSLGRCWGFTLMRMIKAAFLALALAGTAANSPPDVPIRLNQIGLLPDGPKRALLPDAATAPLGWTLTDAGGATVAQGKTIVIRSEEHTSELQSLMRISYAVFCLKKKTPTISHTLGSKRQTEPTYDCRSTETP